MNRSLIALFAALALAGCDPEAATTAPTPEAPEAPEAPAPEQPAPETPEPERPEQPTPETPETPEVPAPETPPAEPERPGPTPVGAEMTDNGSADLKPTPEPWMPTERARRRMNVDQLNAAFRRASNGIGWEERRGNNTVDLFEDLSRTLGKPDYIQVTTEALEPSALFQKFLDDAARSVCAARIERDQSRGAVPVVLPEEGVDVDTQLQALLLRFHGRDVELDSPDLAHWRWLFDSVSFVSADEITPWNAVCVGLYTHPDFYSY